MAELEVVEEVGLEAVEVVVEAEVAVEEAAAEEVAVS